MLVILQKTARQVLGGAARIVDHAVNLTALSRVGGQRQANALSHQQRLELLALLARRYSPELVHGYFRDPRPIEPLQRERALLEDGAKVIDLSWPSEYRAFFPEVQERYEQEMENRTCAARLVARPEPRPVAVLVHGYMGGVHRTERRVWPLGFLRRIGMDVALFVLPFHGPRGRLRAIGEPPPFPGADPRVTNEGFRQAINDLRDFVRWLLERGHPTVGVMGMSLGGFTSALAATTEPRLAFCVPIIPLASIADTARQQKRLGSTPAETDAQYRALVEVYRVTSPLHRPPVIPSSSILVIGGEQDRITPISHARRLALHFRCRMETWHGGHLMQLGRAEKFRQIGRFLNELGVVRREGA